MPIRSATSDDAAMLAREFWYPLAKQMEAYSELNELRENAAEHATSGFERLLASDDHRIFLLETDDDREPVAFVVVEFGDHPSRKRGAYASINDLFVKEDHRGQGYGSALVKHAEVLADDADCDFLKVSAEWGNERARKVYRRLGYELKQVTFAKSLDQ